MADQENTATFAFELEDKTSGSAKDAAKAVENLKAKYQESETALKAMERAQRAMKGGHLQSSKAYKDLTDKIKAHKTIQASTVEQYTRSGGSLKKFFGTVKGGESSLGGMAKGLKGAGGPVGGLTSKLGGLTGKMKGLGEAGKMGGFIAGIIAADVAVIAATAALTIYAIKVADARRSELLMLEGLTRAPNFFGIAAGKATDLQEAIDRVSGSAASSRQQVTGLAQELYKGGLRGGAFAIALKAAQTAADGADAQTAAFYKNMIMGAAYTGQSVRKVADLIEKRFGDIARGKALSLPVQWMKFKENIAKLFVGIKIEGFLKALQSGLALFDQTTASGRALRVTLEGIVGPLVKGFEGAGPIVKRFFQGFLIILLEAQIGFNEMRLSLRRIIGKDVFKNFDALSTAMWIGKAAAFGLVAGLLFLAISTAILLSPIILLGIAIWGLIKAWDWLTGKPEEVVAAHQAAATEFKELGKNIATGTAEGVRASSGEAVKAVQEMTAKMNAAAAAGLEAHSPSKLFKRLGFTAPQGLALGIRAGTPLAERAVDSMIPNVPALDADFSRVSSSNSRSISIGELHVHASGKDAPSFGQSVKQELNRILEEVSIGMAAPEGATR